MQLLESLTEFLLKHTFGPSRGVVPSAAPTLAVAPWNQITPLTPPP